MTDALQKNIDFQRYKKIKDLFEIEYRGYNLKPLIAHDIARVSFSKKWPKLKSFTRFFIRPRYNQYIEAVSKDGYLFSKIFTGRKDHEELLKAICSEISAPFNFIDLKCSYSIAIWPKNILSSLKQIIEISNQIGVSEFIYYWASLTYYKNYLFVLDKYLAKHVKTKAFIAHNSSLIPYSIWVLFFNKYNVSTYSNQHGLNVNFIKQVPLAALNFENITANNILCWGGQTVEEIKKFGNNNCNLILAGNPKYKGITIRKMKQTFKNCIVLLGGKIYNNENILLLKLLSKYSEEFNVCFHIKVHPSLSKKKYKKIVSELNLVLLDKNILMSELLKSGNFDFAISYNSSAYYETMPYGIPCLRFSIDGRDSLYGLNDKFSSSKELNDLINKLKIKDNQEFNNEVTNLLNFVLGINNINYSNIFQ